MRASLWGCLSLVWIVVSCVETARALDKPAASAHDEQLKLATARLDAGDEAGVKQALDTLVQLGGEPAARAVAARLQRGLPPQLISAAIDALVLLDRPSSAAVLLELTQHRRSPIRSQAIQALGALKQQSAQAALLYALDDPSAEVRRAAVDALGSVGTGRAVPALLIAAERGVPGAWQSLGRVARPQDVAALLQRAPDGDVRELRPALDALLVRHDWPLAARVRLVQQLAGLGSPSARAYLEEQRGSQSLTPQLKPALADALARLDREHPPETMLVKHGDPKAPKGEAASAAPPGLVPPPAATPPGSKPSATSVAKVAP